MNGAKAYASAYRETSVKTASQGQIIVMLYDAAIRNMDAAVALMGEPELQYEKINQHIMKARDIFTELQCSLDMEHGGQFSERMFGLYFWFNKQLLEANIAKSPDPIVSVRAMSQEIREAWSQIAMTTQVEGRGISGINLAG